VAAGAASGAVLVLTFDLCVLRFDLVFRAQEQVKGQNAKRKMQKSKPAAGQMARWQQFLILDSRLWTLD
jgi:hypothetical protein